MMPLFVAHGAMSENSRKRPSRPRSAQARREFKEFQATREQTNRELEAMCAPLSSRKEYFPRGAVPTVPENNAPKTASTLEIKPERRPATAAPGLHQPSGESEGSDAKEDSSEFQEETEDAFKKWDEEDQKKWREVEVKAKLLRERRNQRKGNGGASESFPMRPSGARTLQPITPKAPAALPTNFV